jgi:hypothetical protein
MKYFYMLLVSVGLLALFQAGNAQTIYLFDNFESYNENTPIADTGWLEWHSGAGNHKVLTDADPSRNKVLQINGQSGWAGEYYKGVEVASVFEVETYVKVAQNSGFNASLSLMAGTTWGCRVSLDAGKIWAVEGNNYSGKYELTGTSYAVGEWVHIRLVVNNSTRLFSVYINNELKMAGAKSMFSTAATINRVLLTGGHNGYDTRFDEVKVIYGALVAHYPFDGNAQDMSSLANHGAENGDVVYVADRHGNPSGAVRFDGNGDYIQCPTATGPFGTQSRTITFWAKTDVSPASQQQNSVLSYGGNISNGGSRFELLLNAQCRGVGIDGSVGYLSRSFDNSDNDWHFYAVVVNEALGTKLSQIQFYGDGQLLETVCGSNGADVTINTLVAEPLFIGRLYYSGQPRYFRGDLDDLRIYNYPMDAVSILSMYEKGWPTGLKPRNELFDFSIYPNPAKHEVFIKGLDENAVTVTLYNAAGQPVLTRQVSGVNASVNINRLPIGMYLLQVKHPHKSVVLRFVKH